MKTCLVALMLTLCHGIVRGELKWDRQRVELTPGPLENFVDATFGFVNAGTEPVVVEKLEPSCGCTTATLPKMTIEPGERSQLVTRFDITGRRGLQTKTVTVHIKGTKEPAVLSLIVSIPDLVNVSPVLVIWEKGEAVVPKKISLQAMEGQTVKIAKVLSSEGSIKARLETIQEGRQYAISVTPGNTAAASFSVLTIEAEFQGKTINLRAYAQVRDMRQ